MGGPPPRLRHRRFRRRTRLLHRHPGPAQALEHGHVGVGREELGQAGRDDPADAVDRGQLLDRGGGDGFEGAEGARHRPGARRPDVADAQRDQQAAQRL